MPKAIPANNQAIINELEKKKNECYSRSDSKLGHTFQKAIKGIRDCEVEINSGADAQKNINGVGPYIAKKIDEILQQLKTSSKGNQNANSQPQTSTTVPQTLVEWLAQIGYLSYLGAFEDAGYDNIRVCEELDEKDLDAIDIKKPGHRKTIILASKALKLSREQALTSPFFGFNGVNVNSNSIPSSAPNDNSEPAVPKIVRTINGGVAPKLTKDFININASMSIVERGEELLKNGHVQSIILNGDRMNCKVQSSDPEKDSYQILIELDVFKDKVTKASCNCPFSGGWCKHVVAVLLAVLYEQERKDPNSPLNTRSISNSNVSQSSPKPSSRPAPILSMDEDSHTPVTWMDESSVDEISKKTKKKSTTSKDGTKKPRKPPIYIPTYRSGPWAILIALYEASLEDNYKGYLTKKELVERASLHSNTSFTESETYYTAFSSMKTLTTKNLVIKQKSPAQYLLTDAGEQLAKALYQHKDKGELGTKKDIILPLLSPVKGATLEPKGKENEPPTTKKNDFPPKKLENEFQDQKYDVVMVKEENYEEETQSASQLFPDYQEPSTFHLQELSSTSSIKSNMRSKPPANSQRIEIILDADSDEEKKDSSISNISSRVSTSKISSIEVSRNNLSNSTIIPKEPNKSVFPFEIILLLDYREIKKPLQKNLYKGLKQSGIKVEKRNLDLGDVMWVARRSTGITTEEVVIDFIVERKRISDLMESIFDGRYKEQKFRLKKCGINNVMYLVEGNFDNLDRPDMVENALVHTQVFDGFAVQRTSSEEDTTTFLTNMTKNFCELNNSQKLERVLTNMQFEEFTSASSKSKNLTVTDVFAKQLIQLNMLGPEKAYAIVNTYKTPRSLLEAYRSKNSEKEKEDLLKNIEFGNPPKKRKIGSVMSKAIYSFYSRMHVDKPPQDVS